MATPFSGPRLFLGLTVGRIGRPVHAVRWSGPASEGPAQQVAEGVAQQAHQRELLEGDEDAHCSSAAGKGCWWAKSSATWYDASRHRWRALRARYERT